VFYSKPYLEDTSKGVDICIAALRECDTVRHYLEESSHQEECGIAA